MAPDPDEPLESEGVLNPASARGSDGALYLLPRMVAAGNVSRVGLARVVVTDGVPTGVERLGVVLEPETSWETAEGNAGVEDPRVTWVETLGLHVMTYVAFGPLGPRTAIATSTDLRRAVRLGPAGCLAGAATAADPHLFHNKDTVFFPEPVVAPDGVLSLAVLHRPMGLLRPFRGDDPAQHTPPGPAERRQSIWISFVPLADVLADRAALTVWRGHRWLAGPEQPWEEIKIGGGPPPVAVPGGWLVLHHGVTGEIDEQRAQQQHVRYVAGGLLLDRERPWLVLSRSTEPLLEPATDTERVGIVPNVVFPTAVEEIDGTHYVFYGMADSAIGVARLVRRNA